MTIHSKVHAHIMLTQLIIREGLMALGERRVGSSKGTEVVTCGYGR